MSFRRMTATGPKIGLRATVTVEVAASIALLLAAIACLVAAARTKQHDLLRTVMTTLDAFPRWSGVPPSPPMEAPPAAVVRARFPWVTIAVILMLIGVFIAEITITPGQHDDVVSDLTLMALGGLNRQLVLGGEVQRVFMSSLLHLDADHLAVNCLILAVMGWYLERMVGHAWLACVLGLGVVGGGVGTMLLTPDCLSAGASGAIIAVVAAAFIVSFRRPPSRQRLIIHAILLVVALITLLPAVVTPDDPDIDNGGHFGGWVTGLAIGWLLWRAWPADPTRMPLRRLSRGLVAALACAFLLSSAAVARKYPHYEYYNRGLAFDREGRHDEAIADYTKAIAFKPDDADAYYRRGADEGGKGMWEQAIADFAKAIALKPDYADAFNYRGLAYGKKGLLESAISDYTSAIELKPDFVWAYENRGWAYGNKGLYDEAVADFTKAIALKPDYADAYSDRGYAYAKKGLWEEALTDYNKAITLKPDFARAYFRRGIAYAHTDRHDQAIVEYTQAIALNPGYAVAYNNRGWEYHLKGEDAKGLPDAEKAVALAPNEVNCLGTRAEIHEKLGQRDQAVADYRAALTLNPHHQPALDGLARLGIAP
jgi:tetratricopeptide (TPR) repeat protein/membrane associated rhomboid family serine protease